MRNQRGRKRWKSILRRRKRRKSILGSGRCGSRLKQWKMWRRKESAERGGNKGTYDIGGGIDGSTDTVEKGIAQIAPFESADSSKTRSRPVGE